MTQLIWKRKKRATLMVYCILIFSMSLFSLTGCNETGAEGGGSTNTKTYKSKYLPTKFMEDMPASLKNNKKNTSQKPDTSKSLVERTAMKKKVGKAKTSETTDCDSGGYDILKTMISEAEIFKAETEFELMIIDSMFQQAQDYVSKNGNPVPAGKLESEFTVEMKNKLLEQFSKEVYGDEFVNFVSNALNDVIGKKITSPEITIIEDPSDTNADGYHFVASYGEIETLDLETIIEGAWDKIFDAYTLWENDDIEFENEEFDDDEFNDELGDDEFDDDEFDDDEFNDELGDDEFDDDDYNYYAKIKEDDSELSFSTSVMWSNDKSKVAIERKDSGSYSFTDNNDKTIKSTFEYIENCKFDSATNTTSFSASEKDNYAEASYSFVAQVGSDDSTKIIADNTFKSLEDNFEATWKMEIITTKSGGQMLEIFNSKDPSNNDEAEYKSFKETFNNQGKIIELFYKETENGEWQKMECDDFNDRDEDDWDDEDLPDDTISVTVTGITEKDISFVIAPADIQGPGESGYNVEAFELSVTGMGYICDDGEIETFFWGNEETLVNPGVKVYKETFDEANETDEIKYTLLSGTAVIVSE